MFFIELVSLPLPIAHQLVKSLLCCGGCSMPGPSEGFLAFFPIALRARLIRPTDRQQLSFGPWRTCRQWSHSYPARLMFLLPYARKSVGEIGSVARQE